MPGDDDRKLYALWLTDEEGEQLRTIGRAARKGSLQNSLGIDTTDQLDESMEYAYSEDPKKVDDGNDT